MSLPSEGSFQVKLCDFGIARYLAKSVEIREVVGTPDFVGESFIRDVVFTHGYVYNGDSFWYLSSAIFILCIRFHTYFAVQTPYKQILYILFHIYMIPFANSETLIK